MALFGIVVEGFMFGSEFVELIGFRYCDRFQVIDRFVQLGSGRRCISIGVLYWLSVAVVV